jgi:DNA-binding NarL/FixJ family response regulator
MEGKINLAIVEENRLYRESLRSALSQIADFNIMLEGDTVDDIVRVLVDQSIDLVLLSVDIEKSQGYNSLKQIRQLFPTMKILVLLDYPETCYYENAISEGANDAISKFSSKRTIEHHLRSILKVNENLQNEINIQSTTNN